MKSQTIGRLGESIRGFAAVGVVLGILVFLLGGALIALSAGFWIGLKDVGADENLNLNRAVNLAAQEIETLRLRGYRGLSPGTTTEDEIEGHPGFSRLVTVEDDVPTVGARQVTVRVRGPLRQRVQMQAVIAR